MNRRELFKYLAAVPFVGTALAAPKSEEQSGVELCEVNIRRIIDVLNANNVPQQDRYIAIFDTSIRDAYVDACGPALAKATDNAIVNSYVRQALTH